MTKLSIEEAHARLPELLQKAACGEKIAITGDGAVYEVTVQLHAEEPGVERIAGLHAGALLYMSDDFNDELPDSFWFGDEA